MLMKYNDNQRDPKGVTDLTTNVPLGRYLTRTSEGLDKLRDELVTENEGLKIPLTIRWPGKAADIAARWARRQISALSVTFAIKGKGVTGRIVKEGTRVCGKGMRAFFFVPAGPGALCTACSGWGHIEEKCAFLDRGRSVW